MSIRLNQTSLPNLDCQQKPSYNRANIKNGILHLGIGNFHRAHQAVYTEHLLAKGETDWGITGVSLRSESTQATLAPQNFLYTVQARDQDRTTTQIVASVMDVIALPRSDGLAKTVAAIANPTTQVVTLTITEKGYCHNPQGMLDESNPGIVLDRKQPQQPQTAPGLLALGLQQRMLDGAGPLTILSCDNLAANGQVTGNVVRTMLQHQFPGAYTWVENNVSFPSSMVDRIVPQTSQDDITQLEHSHGYLDQGLVTCEHFSQWVIEDAFAGRRPAWDLAGAQFVSSVAPYEQAKLRFLNATHSALAYLGLLAGYEYIHQAVADPKLASFAQQLMDIEVEPVVARPPGLDLAGYKASILARFANPAVPYRTAQVASDGSQKLPQRILPTIQAQRNLGVATPRLQLVVAAWLHNLVKQQDNPSTHGFSDPGAAPVLELATKQLDSHALVHAIASRTSQFGSLQQDNEFLQGVASGLTNLRQNGSLRSVTQLVNS